VSNTSSQEMCSNLIFCRLAQKKAGHYIANFARLMDQQMGLRLYVFAAWEEPEDKVITNEYVAQYFDWNQAVDALARFETLVPSGQQLFSKQCENIQTVSDDWDEFASKIFCEWLLL